MNPALVRFIAVYLITLLVGFGIEVLPWVQNHLVKPYIHSIAWTCGFLIRAFGGTVEVSGPILLNPDNHFSVAIRNGCSGLEVIIHLAAGVMAFQGVSWRQRLVGFCAGVLTILVLNEIRIISLFYIGQYSRSIFDLFHLYVWDLLIFIDSIVVYFLWIQWLMRSRQRLHVAVS
jgi:exosortase H (IPTLxxWG-CTERM-specific)